MRKRQEIEGDLVVARSIYSDGPSDQILLSLLAQQKLEIEVLLDIRDLLTPSEEDRANPKTIKHLDLSEDEWRIMNQWVRKLALEEIVKVQKGVRDA
jgi:hypothetical protein